RRCMTTKVDIVFDAQADVKKAREFLTELGQQGLDIQIVGVSRAESVAETQRALVLTQRMRAADLVVVLLTPAAVSSKSVAQEIGFALAEDTPMIGVLIGGLTTRSALPKGVERAKVYGWDWGTLKRVIR
ncbi:MAG: TIR domain-containing protein, partial [Proteobacteria bacterium]|nr:TIR domain-containing protein [Pseudomonadota bacterium]